MDEKERKLQLQRARYKRWCENHPGGGAAASREHRAKTGSTPWPAKREQGIQIKELKEALPCEDCGNRFPACCMDFDHRDGEVKVNNVGTLVAHGYSSKMVWDEIAKCDLVCANCHRIRTQKRGRKRGLRSICENPPVEP